MASANCGTAWTQTFAFDPFGNISKSGTSSYLPNYVLPNGSINNQVQSVGSVAVTSDLDGNLTSDTFHQYTWDAEGRMLTVDGTVAVLIYDAFGRMIEQKVASSNKEILYSPTGAKLALMSGQNLSKAFVGLPGGATAVYASSGLSYYRHSDWLGSERFESTTARAKRFDVAYAPYGEDYIDSGTKELNFTGQNQDTVAGLYDFVYREYHPVSGRWLSPDPAGLGAVDPSNPQSWNRYAYVANNPLAMVDALGLQTLPGHPACTRGSGGEWICRFCHSDGIQSSCGNTYLWNMFDLIQFASTPTGWQVVQGNEPPWTIHLEPVYGNIGVMSLLGDYGPCYYALANPCGGGGPANNPPGLTLRIVNAQGTCLNQVQQAHTQAMNAAQNSFNQTLPSLDWAAVFSLSQLRNVGTISAGKLLIGAGEAALWGTGAKALYFGSKGAVQTVVAEANFVGGYAQCASLGAVNP